MFDVLIIGGGVSGVSAALIFGSAKEKSFMTDKKIGIIAHQKSSSLQKAIFNNAYGIAPGTLGSNLLNSSLEHLQNLYPHIVQIADEKVLTFLANQEISLLPQTKTLINLNLL